MVADDYFNAAPLEKYFLEEPTEDEFGLFKFEFLVRLGRYCQCSAESVYLSVYVVLTMFLLDLNTVDFCVKSVCDQEFSKLLVGILAPKPNIGMDLVYDLVCSI